MDVKRYVIHLIVRVRKMCQLETHKTVSDKSLTDLKQIGLFISVLNGPFQFSEAKLLIND